MENVLLYYTCKHTKHLKRLKKTGSKVFIPLGFKRGEVQYGTGLLSRGSTGPGSANLVETHRKNTKKVLESLWNKFHSFTVVKKTLIQIRIDIYKHSDLTFEPRVLYQSAI